MLSASRLAERRARNLGNLRTITIVRAQRRIIGNTASEFMPSKRKALFSRWRLSGESDITITSATIDIAIAISDLLLATGSM